MCQLCTKKTFGRWVVRIGEGKLGLTANFYDGYSGKKISSYYIDTLLGRDGWGDSIAYASALSLYADCDEWTVYQPELGEIAAWLECITSGSQ